MKDLHSVVKLLKNHIYPTYQLHACMRNNKLNPTEGLVIGVLTVCEWLKSRLGEDVPKELILPSPSDYKKVCKDDFHSLHLNRGFVIDIIALPEKEMWSLQIVEPDLGSDPGNPNQSRKPIAGRIIETNVGFCIKDKRLECGVKTVISDPENTPLAAVYRPAFVKKLYNNPDFGLQHIAVLNSKIKYIDSVEQFKSVANLHKNEENQLPILVFTKKKEVKYIKELPLESLTIQELTGYNGIDKFDNNGNLIKKIEIDNTCTKLEAAKLIKRGKQKGETKVLTTDFTELRIFAKNPIMQQNRLVLNRVERKRTKKEEYVLPPFNIHMLAAVFTGFAHVYLLNERFINQFKEITGLDFCEGDAVLLGPQCFGANNVVYHDKSKENTEKDIIRTIFQYPREKNFNFHSIYFLSGARDALIQGKQELEEFSESQLNQWQIKFLAMQKLGEAELRAHKEELAKLDNKNSSLKQQLVIEETKNKVLHQEQKKCAEEHIQELAKKDEYIKFLERKVTRPHIKKELPGWVERNYKDHLILHPKALQSFDAAFINSDRLELIYDALDYMATDFWENRYGNLTDEELLNRASKKYHRAFEITPCKGTSIAIYPEQYRIPYYKDAQGRIKPSDLNYHMKAGNKSEHLIRIYFLFDDDKKLIVVGSMPEHLQTVMFG